MNRNIIAIAAVIVVLIAAGAAALMMPPSPTGKVIGKDAGAPVKEFVMESYTKVIDGKYYPTFTPKNITVSRGDIVRIKVTNTNGVHDFIIDEFGISVETPLNKQVIVEFAADKNGSFEYYCNKPGHRLNGQWGTLTVI